MSNTLLMGNFMVGSKELFRLEAVEAQGQVSFATLVGLFCLCSRSLLPLARLLSKKVVRHDMSKYIADLQEQLMAQRDGT
jgi:hypothetical protein